MQVPTMWKARSSLAGVYIYLCDWSLSCLKQSGTRQMLTDRIYGKRDSRSTRALLGGGPELKGWALDSKCSDPKIWGREKNGCNGCGVELLLLESRLSSFRDLRPFYTSVLSGNFQPGAVIPRLRPAVILRTRVCRVGYDGENGAMGLLLSGHVLSSPVKYQVNTAFPLVHAEVKLDPALGFRLQARGESLPMDMPEH